MWESFHRSDSVFGYEVVKLWETTLSRTSFCSSSYCQNVRTIQQPWVFTAVLEVGQRGEMERGHELSFLSFNLLSVTGHLVSAAPTMCPD